MRLIVKYTISDGCTYSFDVIEPIIYESKEKAVLDFGSKLLEIEAKIKETNKAYEEWQRRYNSISHPENKLEFFKQRPDHSFPEKFNFGGVTFNYSNFVERDSEKETEYLSEPTIMTVDEWFMNVEKSV